MEEYTCTTNQLTGSLHECNFDLIQINYLTIFARVLNIVPSDDEKKNNIATHGQRSAVLHSNEKLSMTSYCRSI